MVLLSHAASNLQRRGKVFGDPDHLFTVGCLEHQSMGQIVERRGLNSFKNPVFVFDSDKGRHLRQRPHLLTDAFRSGRQ